MQSPVSCDCFIREYLVIMIEQKPDMFAHKLKFILLPQLITTLNNYASSLPPLAYVNRSAFPECTDHVNPQLVKWRQRRPPILLWGPDMAPTTISIHLSV